MLAKVDWRVVALRDDCELEVEGENIEARACAAFLSMDEEALAVCGYERDAFTAKFGSFIHLTKAARATEFILKSVYSNLRINQIGDLRGGKNFKVMFTDTDGKFDEQLADDFCADLETERKALPKGKQVHMRSRQLLSTYLKEYLRDMQDMI
jgi:hypothetical protein